MAAPNLNPSSSFQAPNTWLQNPNGTRSISAKFPLNLAAVLEPAVQDKIFRFMQDNYIWPMVMERRAFEPMWDKILELVRIDMDVNDFNFDEDTNAGKEQIQKKRSGKAKVSDSVVFDAVDRLANMNHFISFKDRIPMQYHMPDYMTRPFENEVYHPMADKIKAGNALLNWNADQENFYLKHLICCRHHYTYGLSYVHSGFVFQTKVVQRQNNQGQIIQREEIERIGTSFDPISIRRIWLDYRVPAWNMEGQTCPFFYTEVPKFAVLQNQYNPDSNPFGYVNLDKLQSNQDLHSQIESESTAKAIATLLKDQPLPQILKPDYAVNAEWTFYPILPLDPETGEWEVRQDGTPVPLNRFIVKTYGTNLATLQTILSIQRNFYPKDKLPIYCSSHMPDMDSGHYTPALGQLLFNHYKEITTCTNQFIENKNWINDPPAWVQVSSPSMNENLTRKGAKLLVNGPNDFGWRQPFDATMSTVAMRQQIRDEAQTTSKAVDAVLGKAMGSRTSATEASNVFQAAMSGVTTDINLFNHYISGEFAKRVWDYAGLWFDPDLLASITGQFGFALKPEDLWLNIGVQCNVGSIFIESVVKQQNIRYVLEAGANDPSINRPKFWTMLLEEMHFSNASELVMDGGMQYQVQEATTQAILAYQGNPIPVAPDQNHEIAIAVKTAFLKDMTSVWNKEHGQNAHFLVKDVQVHQQFLLAQMQQQMQQMEMQAKAEQQAQQEQQAHKQANAEKTKKVPENAGQNAQQSGEKK